MAIIEQIIEPRERDLGGFTVARILPYVKRRMVGPFIFLDHMGPASFEVGHGIDVRPHPHIGLATVTYLFKGNILHRDTLGSVQEIQPGAVNWMTAGRGIAHSERTSQQERTHAHRVEGLQSWVALPKEYEETAPEFFHHTAASLPEIMLKGVKLRLIAGSAYGETAPVKIYSPLFYAEAFIEAGSTLALPDNYTERAVYVVQGEVKIGDTVIAPRTMPVLLPGGSVRIEARTPAHVMLLGGDTFPEKRFIWWNFVSSSEERIEHAKEDWKKGVFGTIQGDDKEFIPLPEEEPKPTIM
ncbi:MAG: pirin family protein [Rickettsiales bacterium]